jgi:hypothetical protein
VGGGGGLNCCAHCFLFVFYTRVDGVYALRDRDAKVRDLSQA